MPAAGVVVNSVAIAITLGAFRSEEQGHELAGILKLVVSGFIAERSVASMAVQLQLAQQVTEESASLDDARLHVASPGIPVLTNGATPEG